MRNKDEIRKALNQLKRQVGKAIDVNDNEPDPKANLIFALYSVADQAIAALPEPSDVVIRWQPEDIQSEAADMGLRLSYKAAREILAEIEDSLEDWSIAEGWEVIRAALYEVKASRSKARRRKTA